MRLKLTLYHKNRQALPINYGYLLSSWVYRTLRQADGHFADWLHRQGFGYGGKHYKLFTFSQLSPRRFQIPPKSQSFILLEPPTKLILSFWLDEAVQHFVMGLFENQRFALYDAHHRVEFEVQSIQMLPLPDFQPTMHYRTLTPLCLSRNEEGKKHAQFLHPADPEFGTRLLQNLLRKQHALHNTTPDTLTPPPDWSFQLQSEPRSKLLDIKGTQVRGYLFDFTLTTTPEMHRLGFLAGFGEKNSNTGMGLVGVRGEKGMENQISKGQERRRASRTEKT